MRGEDRELIAAKACNQVTVAHRRQEALCHHDQHLVADAVPMHVVDPLEPVEIQEVDRMCRAGPRRRIDSDRQCLLELPSIGEPGKAVLIGEFASVLLSGDPPCHFPLLRPVLSHDKAKQR
jgi:hypothetical protein